MQTYIEKKPLVNNPDFARQRETAIGKIDYNDIDTPIVELIRNIAKLKFCFTLQCCFGHFVYDDQQNIHNIEPLKQIEGSCEIEYRIAYIAFCVDYNKAGIELLAELEKIVNIDNDYIQFGCADWFWERQKNSYVLQVQPKRLKDQDKMIVDIQEAYHLEFVKRKFFSRLSLIIENLL